MAEAEPIAALRGQQREDLARELAARYTRRPMPIADLAAEIHRRPTLVRRLLEEAGIVVSANARRSGSGVGELADRYQQGESLEKLAKATGIDRRVVRDLLTGVGVIIREHRALPASRQQWVVEEYEKGITLRELAQRTGCSYGTVRRYLLSVGVHLRSPGRR
ncbi:MAG TPA: helix-turn-helix domain-containing protein [Pseudonocardiaceae bacterium]|nr:helix-turn-helix domain-containing protein [Pseudonocardiaceae bacterium]